MVEFVDISKDLVLINTLTSPNVPTLSKECNYKGRKFVIVKEESENFTFREKKLRRTLGVLALIFSLGFAYLSKPIKNLFLEQKKTVFYIISSDIAKNIKISAVEPQNIETSKVVNSPISVAGNNPFSSDPQPIKDFSSKAIAANVADELNSAIPSSDNVANEANSLFSNTANFEVEAISAVPSGTNEAAETISAESSTVNVITDELSIVPCALNTAAKVAKFQSSQTPLQKPISQNNVTSNNITVETQNSNSITNQGNHLATTRPFVAIQVQYLNEERIKQLADFNKTLPPACRIKFQRATNPIYKNNIWGIAVEFCNTKFEIEMLRVSYPEVGIILLKIMSHTAFDEKTVENLKKEYKQLEIQQVPPIKLPYINDFNGKKEQIEKIFSSLLQNSNGFIVGESSHYDIIPKEILMYQMENLAKEGVKTFFLEFCCYDSLQFELDEFFTTKKPSLFLEKVLFYGLGSNNRINYLPLLQAAVNAGIRPIGLERYDTLNAGWVAGMDGGHEGTARMLGLNVGGKKIIDEETKKIGGKFIALLGSSHNSYYHDIAGFSELCGVPSVVITRNNQKSEYLTNVLDHVPRSILKNSSGISHRTDVWLKIKK